MSRFLTELDTRDIDGKRAKLLAPLIYESDLAGGIIYTFTGFVTDWASIPQAVQSVVPRNGLWDWAAVIHDLLYGYNGAVPILKPGGQLTISGLDREGCDDVLLEAMKVKGVSDVTCQVIYDAVRLGGGSAWDAHAKESQAYPISELLDWKRRNLAQWEGGSEQS